MDRVRKIGNAIPCKVVMLGDAGSGKTCLLERFLHNAFDLRSKPTIGAAFGSKLIDVDGGLVSLQIWDTAGQERYLSLASLYYRNAHAAIVCCDLTERKSFQRMEYWIKAVRSAERNCKIYVCGTKVDLIWDKIKSRAILSEELTIFKAPALETSSKVSYNVIQLFHQIANDVERVHTGGGNPSNTTPTLALAEGKGSSSTTRTKSENCCQNM